MWCPPPPGGGGDHRSGGGGGTLQNKCLQRCPGLKMNLRQWPDTPHGAAQRVQEGRVCHCRFFFSFSRHSPAISHHFPAVLMQFPRNWIGPSVTAPPPPPVRIRHRPRAVEVRSLFQERGGRGSVIRPLVCTQHSAAQRSAAQHGTAHRISQRRRKVSQGVAHRISTSELLYPPPERSDCIVQWPHWSTGAVSEVTRDPVQRPPPAPGGP